MKNLGILLAGIVIGVLGTLFWDIFAHYRASLAEGAGLGFWIGVGAVVAMAVLNWLVGALDELGNAIARKS